MSEIRRWLEVIGLAQYADAFEANDLDIDLLGEIDDRHARPEGSQGAAGAADRMSAKHELRAALSLAKPYEAAGRTEGQCGAEVFQPPVDELELKGAFASPEVREHHASHRTEVIIDWRIRTLGRPNCRDIVGHIVVCY